MISCLYRSNPYFLLFLSFCLFQRRSIDQRSIIEAGDEHGLCPAFVSSQVSKAWRWHARSHFYCAFNSHPHILLYLSSCLFRRRSLDHSNIIEGGKSSLFCSVLFWEQTGEMKFNLFFHDSIFFLTHLFFSTDIPFQLTSDMSSGSGAAVRCAGRPAVRTRRQRSSLPSGR